jgi:hypothetical protein
VLQDTVGLLRRTKGLQGDKNTKIEQVVQQKVSSRNIHISFSVPVSGVRIEKPRVFLELKNSPAFYSIQRFFTMFTTAFSPHVYNSIYDSF